MINLICTSNGIKYLLDVDTDIYFTYQQTDFSQPEAVKNGYTKTIELKASKNNVTFFESAYRFDRTNSRFDPTKKVECAIVENGGLVDKGYIVLDTVKIEDELPVFNITFYSNLGRFFYNLSVDEDGNSVYLSDLYWGFPSTDYKYTLSKEQETSTETIFTLNSKYIYDSWASLQSIGDSWTQKKNNLSLKEKLLCNVVPVPCYSGYSDNIDTENALIYDLSQNTLAKFKANESAMNGLYKAELAREMDEWEIGDLRASDQHLGVRWSFILDTIFNPENNGGFTVNFPYKDDNQSFVGRYYNNGFVVFPKVTDTENINLSDEETLNSEQQVFKANTLGDLKINPTIDTSNWTNVILDLDIYTTWKVRSKTKGIDNCYTTFKYWSSDYYSKDISAKDLTIVNFLGVWISYRSIDGYYKKKWFSLLCSPKKETTIGDNTIKEWFGTKWVDELRTCLKSNYWNQCKSDNTFWGKVYRCLENPIFFDSALVAGTEQDTNVGTESNPLYQSEFQNDIALRLLVDDINKDDPSITVLWDFFEVGYTSEVTSYISNGRIKLGTKYTIYDLNNSSDLYFSSNHSVGYGTVDSNGYVKTENIGYLYQGLWCYLNNSTSEYYSAIYNTTSTELPKNNVKKQLLFGTDYTACDFLLQFIKQCNLRIKFDKLKNQIDILTVGDYYKDKVVDITSLVDNSKEKEVNYNYYDFTKLGFGFNNSVGSEAESYPEYLYYKKNKGSMNNYTFSTDNSTKDDSSEYLSDCLFNSAVDYNLKSQWCSTEQKSFLLKGAKCTLVSFKSGSLTELDTEEYLKQWNLQTKYLDPVPKLALFDKDNSSLDGYFTAFFCGFVQLKYPVQVSDNTPVQQQLNDDCCYVYWLDKVMDGTTKATEGEVTGIVRLNPEQTGTIGYNVMYLPLFGMNDYYYDSVESGTWQVIEKAGDKQGDLVALDDQLEHPKFGLWWTKPTILYSNNVLPNNTLYGSCFGNYISDIYDNNTFTVTLYLRLPIGTNLNELFRQFFWYDNSLFVLNKITDYNPFLNDAVQVELIKVQDKYHYI
jgi:hypothetical protein